MLDGLNVVNKVKFLDSQGVLDILSKQEYLEPIINRELMIYHLQGVDGLTTLVVGHLSGSGVLITW